MEESLIEKRQKNPVRDDLAAMGLYHSIELKDGRVLRGSMPMEWQQTRLAAFGLPEDLRGKRVLDIGPWDGFYTFEMERRGAAVTAVDYVDLDTFRTVHRALGSRAEYLQMDVYELDPARVGTFDIVLCLGTLYHFKYPLLALEKVCAVTRDVCVVDTFVADGGPDIPYLEFYERDELGGQFDNWCGPSVSAVPALLRSAGFVAPEVRRVSGGSACVVAYRRWRNLPANETAAPRLVRITGNRNRGRCFSSSREEYPVFWCEWQGAAPAIDDVFPEVDGLGSAPLSVAAIGGWLQVTIRVPPGLAAGRHEGRLKVGGSEWTEAGEFFLDLPEVAGRLEVLSVQDGVTWELGAVDWASGGWMTVWVDGLTAEADAGNTVVDVDGVPHTPEDVVVAHRQVNVKLRPLIGEGKRRVKVRHRGMESEAVEALVRGRAPAVRGLEGL